MSQQRGLTQRLVYGLGILVASLLGVVVVAATGLYFYVQSDAMRKRVETGVGEAIERPVSLQQNLSLAPGWPPRITVNGIRIANPEWAEQPWFMQLDKLEVAPALAPLLQARLGLNVLAATRGKIVLHTGPQGQGNWPRPSVSDNAKSRVFLNSLAGARVEDFTLAGDRGEARFASATLAAADSQNRWRLQADGELAGQSFAATMTLPDRDRAEKTGQTAEPLRFVIESVEWGESDLSGELLWHRSGEAAPLRGMLKGRKWVFANSSEQSSSDEQDQAGLLPSAPIPLEWRALPGTDIKLQVETLRLGDVTVDDFATELFIEGEKLRLDPLSAKIDGATLATRLDIDASQAPPRVGFSGRIDQLNLRSSIGPLLAEENATEGYVNAEFELHGRGADTRVWLTDINGKMRLIMAQGRVSTAWLNRLVVDLGRLLNTADESPDDSGTPIRCLAIEASAESGVITLEDMIADTRRLLLVGDGTVNLDSGEINVSLNPSTGGLNPAKFAVPIDIRGTLSEPRGEADASATLAKPGSALVSKFFSGVGLMCDLIGLSEPGDTGCRATLREYAPDE